MHKATHQRKANGKLQTDFAKLKKAIAEAGMDVKGKAGNMLVHSYEDIQTSSINMKENVADYVAEKPFKSLGIAVLSGFIIGYILKK